jgi:hypothetical protein
MQDQTRVPRLQLWTGRQVADRLVARDQDELGTYTGALFARWCACLFAVQALAEKYRPPRVLNCRTFCCQMGWNSISCAHGYRRQFYLLKSWVGGVGWLRRAEHDPALLTVEEPI